jgi:hypothetical protein
MGADNPNLGDIALNKVVEMAIDSQLDTAEQINVDLRTNPLELIQGKVDAIEISGRGLVVKQDLRMETLKINSDAVAIDPLKAVFGNIELTHPTDAEAQIVLTCWIYATSIFPAYRSDYTNSKHHKVAW